MNIADLTQSYATKTDEELLRLAGQSEQLTIEARATLSSELTRRRIDVTVQSCEDSKRSPKSVSRRQKNDARPTHIKTGPFIAEVLRFYNRRRWVFFQLIFPAVLLGFVAISFARYEARAIAQGLYPKYGLSFSWLLLLTSLIYASGRLASWTAFCFSFAAISCAVEQEDAGCNISISESLGAVRERLGTLLRVALLLLGGFVALEMVVLTPISGWIIPFVQEHFGKLNSLEWFIVDYVGFAFIAFILSRFSLALPAVILDDCSVTDSFFRSYDLTSGKFPILVVLLFKGIVVSYLAGMLPFWVARWIPANVDMPSWFHWVLSGASILCVSVVEPIMFIGFALLYLKTTAATPDKPEAVTA